MTSPSPRYLVLHHRDRSWRIRYDRVDGLSWHPRRKLLRVLYRWARGTWVLEAIVADETLRLHPSLLDDLVASEAPAFELRLAKVLRDEVA